MAESIDKFFKTLNAPLHNTRWSWGAQTANLTVLKVWEDETFVEGGERKVRLLGARNSYWPGDRLGVDERFEHVRALWSGAHAGYAVRAMVQDEKAVPRKTKDFRPDGVFALVRLEMAPGGTIVGTLGNFVPLRTLEQHRLNHRTTGLSGPFPISWDSGPIPSKDAPEDASLAASSNMAGLPNGASGDGTPSVVTTESEARFARVQVRPQQVAFRLAVFRACGGRCVVSGCDVPEALEAAHLRDRDWRAGHNAAADGILLRRDLHALYDSGLLHIEPDGSFTLSEPVREHYAGQLQACAGGLCRANRVR